MIKPRTKRTKENCLESAKKYETRSAWMKADPNAYAAAHKKGWIDDCCAHMKSFYVKWTREKLH